MVDDQSDESLGPLSSETGRNQHIYAPGHELLYTAVQQDLALSRDRLQLLLERVERRRNAKKYEDAWPWLGVLVAFLIPLIAAEFKEFLGIPGDVWQAVSLFGVISLGIGLLRTIWLAWTQRKDREQTVQQIIEEVIEELSARRDQHPR